MLDPHPLRFEIVAFLKNLREEMIATFRTFENEKEFQRTSWDFREEGGGEMAVLRGDVFEKTAVNFSAVGGKSFPMKDGAGTFFATGVSVITHMMNPHMPTAHFNIRFIETEQGFWFAGGYDLTPMGPIDEEDTRFFHEVARRALEPFGSELYETFAKQAKDYFYIPHRKKERGVGGIFFDHFRSESFEKDFLMWKAIAGSFLDALTPIYRRKVHLPFTSIEKEKQLELRAHYVEFNLLYDRGTKFGFQSGGHPEAILCSMPPVVKW